MNKKQGQSVIEVIIAVSLFVIITVSSVVTLLGSFSTTRLASEETQATYYAVEGLEAVQSIRNQNWDNLMNGDYGLSSSGNVWSFSGASDVNGKFTRVISISDVERDGSGNIVSSGGTVDPEIKNIVSTITWSFTPSRNNTVSSTTYLTNWQISRNIGGVNSGPQPQIGSEDCLIFCKSLGYSFATCRKGVPQCTANGEINESKGNRYCQNEANGATCCCKP